MKQDELDAIRARCEAATPGPWDENEFTGSEDIHQVVPSNPSVLFEHGAICDIIPSKADMRFIAHAREDVPALLDEIDRLRAERKVLWRQVPATKSTIMTYAAVHVLLWRPEWGEPVCGFIQADRKD